MRIVERYGAGMKVLAGRGSWAILKPVRYLLAGVYGIWLGTGGRSKPADTGKRLSGAVRIVSIGNLQVGGGGKTPCTIALAEAIREDGGNPVVVTRGYGSAAERAGLPVVLPGDRDVSFGDGYVTEIEFGSARQGQEDSRSEHEISRTGQELSQVELARLFGDEVLGYRSRRIPVIIDPDRNSGIETAARLFEPSVILLDDGFQHRSVARDLDILLLDAERPFAGGHLLPLGYLREKPDAARRADAVIFTRALSYEVPEKAEPYVVNKPVFFARHAGVDLFCRDGSTRELASLEGRRAVLFSGLARPDSFEHLVAATGADIEASYRFPDHHVYDQGDIGEITAASSPGTLFITTEKDWPKSAQLFDGSRDVMAVRIRMEIEGLERLLALVTGAV